MNRAAKLALLPAILLGLVVLGAAILRPARPEFSTSSREAYKLYLLGEERQNAFQWLAAEEALHKAVQLDPGFAAARALLAASLAMRGQKEEAKREAQLADSLALRLPRETERLLVQLSLSEVMKKYGAERDSLLSLLEQRLPNHPTVVAARAYSANMRGDAEAEEAAWRELLRIDPNHARAYNWLGYAAARRGRYEEALSYLRRYAFLAPDLANPHDSLGEILVYKGDYEEAERELLQALQIQPEFFYSLLSLARLYLEQGRVEKGVGILEQLRTELAGTGLVGHVEVAAFNLYTANALHDRLVPFARKVLAEKNGLDEDTAAIFRAALALHEGRAEESFATVDDIAERLIKSGKAEDGSAARAALEARRHVFRAIAAERQDDASTSVAEWGRALASATRRAPHDLRWLQLRYGEALLAYGDAHGSREQAQSILALNPRHPASLLLLARSEAALGDSNAARAVLERLRAELTKSDPDWPVRTAAEALRAKLGLAPAV